MPREQHPRPRRASPSPTLRPVTERITHRRRARPTDYESWRGTRTRPRSVMVTVSPAAASATTAEAFCLRARIPTSGMCFNVAHHVGPSAEERTEFDGEEIWLDVRLTPCGARKWRVGADQDRCRHPGASCFASSTASSPHSLASLSVRPFEGPRDHRVAPPAQVLRRQIDRPALNDDDRTPARRDRRSTPPPTAAGLDRHPRNAAALAPQAHRPTLDTTPASPTGQTTNRASSSAN